MNKSLLFTILVLNSFAGCLAMDTQGSRKQFEQTDRNCAICAQEITGVMSVLPCGHRFCEGCINAWREQRHNATCPLCRQEIPALNSGLLPVEAAHVPQQQPVQLEHHQDAPVVVEHAPIAAHEHIAHVPVVVRAPERELRETFLGHDEHRATQLLSAHPELIHFNHDMPMQTAIRAFSSDNMVTQFFGIDVACFLIEHGCDVHFGDDALMKTALAHLDFLRLAGDGDGFTRCIIFKNFELIRCLVRHGADVHFGYEALLRLAIRLGDGEMARFCCEQGGLRTRFMCLLYGKTGAAVAGFLGGSR